MIGPLRFLQHWLCLDKRLQAAARRGARKAGCNGFKQVERERLRAPPLRPRRARVPAGATSSTSRRSGASRARSTRPARAGRISRGLGSTTPSSASRPTRPTRSSAPRPARQAEILNEQEEFSYRYSRLKSYSQYLLYDDPARTGPAALKWAGFQTGLRFHGGDVKPSYDAYRLPIVVKKQRQRRPDLGPRAARQRHPLRADPAHRRRRGSS